MAVKKTTTKKTNPPRTLRPMETSKRIVLMTGLFTALQIEETMTLTVIFPEAASTLLTVCLSCITGYITVLSWYFGKAFGENKLKITQSLEGFHEAMSDITAAHKSNKSKTKTTVVEEEEEIDEEDECEG